MPGKPNKQFMRGTATRKVMVLAALTLLLMLTTVMPGTFARAEKPVPPASSYEYSDTRELVYTVDDAAKLLAAQGTAAFAEFAKPDTRWLHGTSYLYVYAANGDCLFNSGQPDIVGRNMQDYRDVGGRPVVQELMQIAADPEPHAAGWVFFLFQEGNVLTPVWKMSYNVKTTLPDGRVVVVGSGRSNLKMERQFVTDRVDAAAALLAAQGRDAAFKDIADPSSRFNVLGSYLFVLDMQGHTVIDPSFPTMPGRDLSGMTDAIGRSYVRELLTKLADADTASTMFFWQANASDVPARKAIYARKVSVDGVDYVVGAEYLLPTPIWMK